MELSYGKPMTKHTMSLVYFCFCRVIYLPRMRTSCSGDDFWSDVGHVCICYTSAGSMISGFRQNRRKDARVRSSVTDTSAGGRNLAPL